MKFLLAALNAKYIHSNPALYSLRAYAEKYHPEAAAQVELAEYTINQTVEEILADLYERKPEAVAFSCYIWNWKMMHVRASTQTLYGKVAVDWTRENGVFTLKVTIPVCLFILPGFYYGV